MWGSGSHGQRRASGRRRTEDGDLDEEDAGCDRPPGTAGLTLTACGEDTDDATMGSTSRSSSSSVFNDADVTFAQQMVPHQEQAVEMAELAQDRADSGEVLDLAENIEAAQGPESETLQGWLEEWGAEAPSGGMDHGDMGHESDGGMPGMMDVRSTT